MLTSTPPSPHAYDRLIREAGARHQVEPALIKAIIAQESRFRPRAHRPEPNAGPNGDGSYGLMQILLATARALGHTGPAEGLYDPATNIEYGTRCLVDCLRRASTLAGAVSAYNGGYRPQLGFGEPARRPLRICLAWDTAQRGNCLRWRHVAPGEFANQSYVDAVLRQRATYVAEGL